MSPDDYWDAVIAIVLHYRPLTRASVRFDVDESVSDWGGCFLRPTTGYLEHTMLGPVPTRDFTWLELTVSPKASRDALVLPENVAIAAALRAAGVPAQIEKATVTLQIAPIREPVTLTFPDVDVVRVENPFRIY